MNILVTRLKALADPTRLRILHLLSEAELSVSELTSILGMAQSRVSSHLAMLRDARLVQDRRQGTSAFYSLAGDGEAVETWNVLRESDSTLRMHTKDAQQLAQTLRRRQEKSREFFDRVAAEWDGGRSESLGVQAGGLALAGLLPRRLTVVDLGTGTGILLPLLQRHVGRVMAVDLSAGMLKRARTRMEEEGRSASLMRADATALPFPDASVDGVVANMVLHHLSHPEIAIREMARVLRPEGRGVIVDFEAHDEPWLLKEEGHLWAGFDPAQVGGWCLDAGLSVPEFQRVPTAHTGRWSRLEVFVAGFGKAGMAEVAPAA